MTSKTLTKKRHAEKVSHAVRLVTTNREYRKFCQASLKRVPLARRRWFKLIAFDQWSDVSLEADKASGAGDTVFISRLCDIPETVQRQVHIGSTSRHLLFLEGLPVEAIASRLVRLGVRNPHRLHIARETTPATISQLIDRIVSGMAHTDGPKRIADACI